MGRGIHTAAYLRNRSPTKSIVGKTPYEEWFGKKPNVSHLRIFGSKVIVLDKQPHRSKLKTRGNEYILIGYSEEAKAYRLWNPTTHKIIKSRDVIFYEGTNTDSTLNTNTIHVSDILVQSNTSSTASTGGNADVVPEHSNIGRGRPKIIRTGKPGRPTKEYHQNNLILSAGKRCSQKAENPISIEDAFSRPDANAWKNAMKKEFRSLKESDTWELVNLPEKSRVIGNKWIFNIKRNASGDIEKYKCRLVAKGCSQKYQVDFFETFSPVVRQSTIRLILALAVQYGLLVHHMDVTSAYLNSDLHDEVFMRQPDGFVDPNFPRKVCKLKKSLYGLKQSGREWNNKLHEVLVKMNFTRCNGDNCVYIKNKKNDFNIIAVYVDDLIIACSHDSELKKIKGKISAEFDTVDKGQLSDYLGIRVRRDGNRGSMHLDQEAYINDILGKFDMDIHCRTNYTPLNSGFNLFEEDDINLQKVDPQEYQSIVGSLMYIATSTRPDIMHSVSCLSQFNSNPNSRHLAAVKHLLRYLRFTKAAKLNYIKCIDPLRCHVDADWGTSADNRRSYTGYVFLLAGAAISWQSKKQQSVALSTTEAEYMAISEAAKEAVYLRRFIKKMGFDEEINEPTTINNDNLGAQQLVRNPVYHARTKHIDIKYHYVREIFKNKLIDLQYVQTQDMIADGLTKKLNKIKHNVFVKSLGITY